MSIPGTMTQETPTIRPSREFRHNGVSDALDNWVTNAIHQPGGQRIMTCSPHSSVQAFAVSMGWVAKQTGKDSCAVFQTSSWLCSFTVTS
ncbi:hypothetical protein K503DRAFT_590149 [Rhizopogon vinicolor AM-OR11-026]|uniref:Uncharacterized protein n=1 Tax=Rhizopogon vinicolor AM-OR11-026 TaxID=1314800 RepID=A0A1B7MJ85_9AGAM|nr:hypothetical protein K503DRAFT_590149 [Rhizopogon vinicolor AM-OR11-026]